jgi:hypothetical protein
MQRFFAESYLEASPLLSTPLPTPGFYSVGYYGKKPRKGCEIGKKPIPEIPS